MLDRLKPRWWGSISHPAMHLPREPIFLEGFPTFWQPSARSDSLIGSKWTTVSSVRENIFLANLISPMFFTSRRWYVDYVMYPGDSSPRRRTFFVRGVSAFSYSRMKINSRSKINDGKRYLTNYAYIYYETNPIRRLYEHYFSSLIKSICWYLYRTLPPG